MAGVGALVSSLLSSIANLLPELKNSLFPPLSSSSSQSPDPHVVEDDLNKLVRTLERIKATLYDAEKREIRDCSVKLWLKELKEMGHAAEYVIDECMYEVYRVKVESRDTSEFNPRKTNKKRSDVILSSTHSIEVPNGIVDHIREIRCRFDEIAKDREALRLHEEDGLRRDISVRSRVPSSHSILEPNVYGREGDKEKVIDMVLSNIHEGVITIVPIVGMGGLGKTTLAQLIYNERRIKEKFNLIGWSCVSENFNVERITQHLIESFTGDSCSLKNISALQHKIKRSVEGKRVFVVLDDVWNEDKQFWELFFSPFMFAVKVAFIVTTRSDRVAKILQTTFLVRLGYLPEKESWFLFQQHAFGGIDHNVDPKLLDLGKKIAKKCGGLPLALKVISNLLRCEDEESWIEILEKDMWEIHAENDIYRVLQISYTHMPMYLRPCFLYCSLFPKNYKYEVDDLVESWIAQGYIESDGKMSLEEIAFEYIVELKERSFLEHTNEGTSWHKLEIHDIIHDLARLNSENEFYSIKSGKLQPVPPNEVLHVYMDDFKGLLGSVDFNNITKVRTLLINTTSTLFDFPEAKSLRVLKLNDDRLDGYFWPQPLVRKGYSIFSLYHLEKLTIGPVNLIELEMIGNLINLKFLSLSGCNVEIIPESVCLLSNLRRLSIKFSTVRLLPESIGDLVCLQKLVIHYCRNLRFLPNSLCKLSSLKTLSLNVCQSITELPDGIGNLTNLRNLHITYTGINYLPHSFSKLNISGQLDIGISLVLDGLSESVSWFNDFSILKGALAILQLKRMPRLEYAHNFHLLSKANLEKLVLSWGPFSYMDDHNKVRIELQTDDDSLDEIININDDSLDEYVWPWDSVLLPERNDTGLQLQVLKSLKPHPNLKHLCVCNYEHPTFPEWMGDRSSCVSLEKMNIISCINITYLPYFGYLTTLKGLEIEGCNALQTISGSSLPWKLQSLTIYRCHSLLSITGMDYHESLNKLVIHECEKLEHFSFELISEKHNHIPSSTGFNNHSPLKNMEIASCPNLQLVGNKVIPSVHINIEISDCPGLQAWCLRHNINYWLLGRTRKLVTSEVGSSSSPYKKLLKKIKNITEGRPKLR